MGKLGRIAFINTFIDETRKNQKEFAVIREKKAEKAQKDELFKLKKKNIESQIKARESAGEITPLDAKGMMKEFKGFSDMVKSQSDVDNAILDTAQTKNMNRQKRVDSIAQQIIPRLTIGQNAKGQRTSSLSFTAKDRPKLKQSEKFDQAFSRADAGEISFGEVGKMFPGKRKDIRNQRIQGLPGKSQRLVEQIDREMKKDEDVARKEGTISAPEDVLADFLKEIVENRSEAEAAGHDVDNILDIYDVTEQEILDNLIAIKDEDKIAAEKKANSGFFKKLRNISLSFPAITKPGETIGAVFNK